MRFPRCISHFLPVKIKVANLLLLGGAFVVAGIASGDGISHYDGGELSGAVTLACLVVFATSAACLWSLGAVQKERAEWESLAQTLGGEYSVWSAGVHGQANGIPVHARVESQQNNTEYLDQTCARYSSAKHFFALTVTLPYNDHASWRVLYKPKTDMQPQGEWHAVCQNSPALSHSLEAAGVADLFAEWDKFTVLKCDAGQGELTLRYPAPHRFFCPTPEEVENEINLLRRVGAIWQHASHRPIAA